MYVDVLNQLMNNLNIQSAHIAGNSLGGLIAWQFALDHPDKLNRLVLLNTAGWPSDREPPLVMKLASNRLTAFMLKNVLPKAFIQNNLEEVYHQDDKITNELVTRYYEMALRAGNRDAFIHRVRQEHKDRSAEISKITHPTLIIWGKHDEWIPLDSGKQFDKELPNGKLAIMDNAGHVPMEELPKKSAQIVLEYLK